MTNAVIAAVIAAIAVILGVSVIYSVFSGSDTQNWASGTLTLSLLIPLVIVVGAIIAILKAAGRG